MKKYFDFRYGQRWQAETVMSMIKRNLGSFVAARKDGSRAVEVMLKVLTHNLMLIAAVLLELFYRAGGDLASDVEASPGGVEGGDVDAAVRRERL